MPDQQGPLIHRTLRLFLDSIGRREEYEFYLRKFQADESACFALVVPDEESVQTSAELMTFDLQFLLRLDLDPLLLLCGENAEANRAYFEAHGDYRLVDLGETEAMDEAIADAVEDACVPVICMPGVEMTEAVASLVPQVAKRVHLLRAAGMLHGATPMERVFYWYTRRPGKENLSPDDLVTVEMAEQWLAAVPSLHISVSSPLYLLQEMFTVRGRGSIIRPGSEICHFDGLEGVDRQRLITLIHEAFGRELRDPAVLEQVSEVYLESRYRGAVLLENHPAGSYLSKFTVGTQARGEGLAQELWEAACVSQPALFWRSRITNPVNQWYERQADGSNRQGEWIIFWRGVSPERLPEIIGYATSRPADFRTSGEP
jgi:hypothetical protein